jgi:hypothetical protein
MVMACVLPVVLLVFAGPGAGTARAAAPEGWFGSISTSAVATGGASGSV